MAVHKLVFIVEWHDPEPPYGGGIAGVFDNLEDAKRLVEKFKGHHAVITDWPINFGDLPKAEKDYQDAAWRSAESDL